MPLFIICSSFGKETAQVCPMTMDFPWMSGALCDNQSTHNIHHKQLLCVTMRHTDDCGRWGNVLADNTQHSPQTAAVCDLTMQHTDDCGRSRNGLTDNTQHSPQTAAVCPRSIQMTVAGGGMTWQMDRVLSTEAHATRDLSSLANFTVVTVRAKNLSSKTPQLCSVHI